MNDANRFRFRVWDGTRMVRDGDYWLPSQDSVNASPVTCYPVTVSSAGIKYSKKLRNDDGYVTVDGRTYYSDWEYDSLYHGGVTLMQSTGLTDKNGTEIFEGDVVRIADSVNAWIIWNEENASFATRGVISRDDSEHLFGAPSCCEVIGNIHQDSHLLDT